MKRLVLVSLCFVCTTRAGFSAIAAELVAAAAVPFAVSDRGPHHNIWTKTVQKQLPDGTVAERTHSYTELATGANYWDGNAWVPSTSEIEIINGNAVARHGQIQVIWSPNSNVAGAVDAQSMDGKRFQSHVLGIAYTSRQNGASFFVANPKDCIGEVAGNTVIYRNAFDFPADIFYVYGPAGLEQNIVLKQALPDPSQAPWNLKREGAIDRVGEVLSVMAETCRLLGHLLAPFAPGSAARLADQLGVPVPYDVRGVGGPGLESLLRWGTAADAWRTGQAEPLFPRTELPEEGTEDPMRDASSPGVAT